MSETKSYEEPDNTSIHNDAAILIYNTLVNIIKRIDKLEEVTETIHKQVKENREKSIELKENIDKVNEVLSNNSKEVSNNINILRHEYDKQGDIIDDLVSSRLQAETDLMTVFNLHKALQNRINRMSTSGEAGVP